jgi:hypothetical protein
LPASISLKRIRDHVVPRLARAIHAAREIERPSAADLSDTWAMVLAALFRLLFITYAEDRDILSCRSSRYRPHSLHALSQAPLSDSASLWQQFDLLCQAVERGNPEWDVPACGGDLFCRDPARSRGGALLTDLALPDAAYGPLLRDLRADWRPRSVLDLGAVYEGLLDCELAAGATGEPSLHRRSAARKTSGTWFTGELLVAHLLDHALEPALADHFARLDALEDRAAGECFFDFHVADIAMGAGHFLVAAVDRIERAFVGYLARRPLSLALSEPAGLRTAIALRCLYGVDVNPLAVTLAHASLWLHALAPGLPMSLLARHLVEGNALVGAATVGEAEKDWHAIGNGLRPFHFPQAFPDVMRRERAGFDVLLGNPPWEKARVEEHAFWARHQPGLRAVSQREYEQERARLRRDRPDLVALLESETEQARALRAALVRGPYPGMGTGDPDLYKAFCWRVWQLAAEGGRVGLVLPRSAFAARGSGAFRRALLAEAASLHVTTLVNNRHWVFADVHPQYTIALAAACKGRSGCGNVALLGPFASPEQFAEGRSRKPEMLSSADVSTWTDTAALPLLPAPGSLTVFTRMREHPRLDTDDPCSWLARPSVELHATADKDVMDLQSQDRPEGFWPVFKGESFDLWQPSTGVLYAWADLAKALPRLLAGRRGGARSRHAARPEPLPCRSPRIAFRDVTRATDSRTMRCALVPPEVLLTHKAPFFLFERGDRKDEAYLLGILSSIPLDWYARRFVETAMTYHVLNPFPVPRPSRRSRLWRRVVALAGRLAAVDDGYAAWAEEVGVAHGPLSSEGKADHLNELDALAAHLYGLSETQLGHVFETFHAGWECSARLAATLRHHRAWRRSS